MKDWKKVKQELLANPNVQLTYKKLEPEYRLAHSLLRARLSKHMTQAELAKKAGVSQVVIARLESGTSNPTVGTISRVAGALNQELQLVGSNN